MKPNESEKVLVVLLVVLLLFTRVGWTIAVQCWHDLYRQFHQAITFNNAWTQWVFLLFLVSFLLFLLPFSLFRLFFPSAFCVWVLLECHSTPFRPLYIPVSFISVNLVCHVMVMWLISVNPVCHVTHFFFTYAACDPPCSDDDNKVCRDGVCVCDDGFALEGANCRSKSRLREKRNSWTSEKRTLRINGACL